MKSKGDEMEGFSDKVYKLFSANSKETEIMLSKKEVDVDIINANGKTALYNANEDKMKILIKYGANVNHVDFAGNTPLLTVSNYKRFLLLLENGADINAENDNGYSCLMKNSLMKEAGVSDYISLLKEKGFDFIGGLNEKKMRLVDIKEKKVWEEMLRQDCIKEIPRYCFRIVGGEDEYSLNNKKRLFLRRFELYSELADYFLQKDEGLFSFILSIYNQNINSLKSDYPEEFKDIFDKHMFKLKASQEKEVLMKTIINTEESSLKRRL